MAETGRLTFAIMRAPRLRLGPVTALRIAIAATVLICWQALAASGLLYRDVVPSLLAIGRQLYLTVADPTKLDVILLSEMGLIALTDRDLARLKRFVDQGGRLVVTADAFFVGTCNDISSLPPEFGRAERFDGIYFLDLPGSAERAAIWPIHLNRYGLDPDAERPADRDWTGAEIAACCRLAALLGVPLKEAAGHVVPVAVTAAEQVAQLRAWASGRCLDATRGGVYCRQGHNAGGATRRVTRPASN